MIQIQPRNANREDWLSFAKENGLSFEVLELSTGECLGDPALSLETENWYRGTNLCTSFHGAFIDVNPASGDEGFAEFSKKRYIESCEQALRVGASNVIFHSSCFSILRGPYLESWAAKSAEFFNSLTEKYPLNIYIENCQDLDPGPLKVLMERCANKRIGVCFDTGHANCSPSPFQAWFSELRGSIGYIHLSDNMGHYDDHMSVGTGTVNWKVLDRLFRALPQEKRENMIFTFEVGNLESVKSSMEFLKEKGLLGFGESAGEGLEAGVLDVPENGYERIMKENLILEQRNKHLFDTFGLYMSDEIARQIVDVSGGTAFGGKEKELTVLMSDLRGFSAISEAMPADKLLDMLSDYFEAMVEAVRKNYGTVLEFVGDSVLAVFGAPIDLKDHADKAVSAAIDMQNAMEEVNRKNEQKGYPALHMGIGINTGRLILGNIGCRRHIKYGAIGNAINMCSRIESFTVGDQIFISPTTKDALKGSAEITGDVEIFPKGFKTPITIYDIKGLDGKVFSAKAGAMFRPVHPLRLRMRVVSDKIVSSEVFQAEFIALGRTSAVILTRTSLKRFDDVRFDITERLYAKVTEVIRPKSPLDPYGKYLVRFTSFPSSFGLWYSSVEKEEREFSL